MRIRTRSIHVGVIMPLKPLFPIELNIASVIRWLGHTCLMRQPLTSGRCFLLAVAYLLQCDLFSSIESQRFAAIRNHRGESKWIIKGNLNIQCCTKNKATRIVIVVMCSYSAYFIYIYIKYINLIIY